VGLAKHFSRMRKHIAQNREVSPALTPPLKQRRCLQVSQLMTAGVAAVVVGVGVVVFFVVLGVVVLATHLGHMRRQIAQNSELSPALAPLSKQPRSSQVSMETAAVVISVVAGVVAVCWNMSLQ